MKTKRKGMMKAELFVARAATIFDALGLLIFITMWFPQPYGTGLSFFVGIGGFVVWSWLNRLEKKLNELEEELDL